MNLNKFKAGSFKQQYQYKSFSPTLINQDWTWDSPEINVLLEKATQALAEFNAYSFIVPDIDLFIEMHIAKEANQSSKIEGTQTNMNDVLLNKEDLDPEKRDDWQEVHNYINAINYAIQQLKEFPLSNRLLTQLSFFS
jgi:Fic family protein